MKILLVHSFSVKDDKPQFNAISYHRMHKPHQVLERLNPEFEIINTPEADSLSVEFLSQFKVVLFLRFITKLEDIENVVKKCKDAGCKVGVDIDDFWELPTTHVAYEEYKKNKLTEVIIKSIKLSDFVITTTPILENEIQKINKNVYIIENGIDTQDPSWIPNKLESNRIRFGFTQGSTHIHDIYLINHDVIKSLKDANFKKNGQINLAFRYKKGEPSIFVGYERLLTDNLETLNKTYQYNLKHEITDNSDQPYKRMDYRDTVDFGTMYNEFDISVCPLVDNKFNNCKSELKMIEAGFMDCAIMLSDVNPYKIICNSENSFLLSERSFFYWQRYILNNPSILEDKKLALKETVKGYDLKLLSNKRKQLYETIIK
jgi:hypothetical protein